MNLRSFHIVAGIAVGAMLVLALWGLTQVGLDAQVPLHWGVDGQPNGWGPAWVAFLLLPAITTGLIVLFRVIPRVEPRRENLRLSESAYRTMAIAVVLLMAVIQVLVVLAGVGLAVPLSLVVGLGIGMLFAVLGNVLTTVRSNYVFGVRTPWTLSSERSWDRTHRMVGRLFVVTGLLLIVLALVAEMAVVMGGLLVMLLGTVGFGYWYSYRVWKTDPDRRATGGAQL